MIIRYILLYVIIIVMLCVVVRDYELLFSMW
mgnify:CR=1 FL=1